MWKKPRHATTKPAPTAAQPMAATIPSFLIFLPIRPLNRNPSSGKSTAYPVSWGLIVRLSPLHDVDLVDVHRLFVPVDRDDDRQAHGSLRRSHGHGEEHERLAGD